MIEIIMIKIALYLLSVLASALYLIQKQDRKSNKKYKHTDASDKQSLTEQMEVNKEEMEGEDIIVSPISNPD